MKNNKKKKLKSDELKESFLGVYTKEWINFVNTYHAPTPENIRQFKKIQEAACVFMDVIIRNTPNGCMDSNTAIQKVREARMYANSAIALKGII